MTLTDGDPVSGFLLSPRRDIRTRNKLKSPFRIPFTVSPVTLVVIFFGCLSFLSCSTEEAALDAGIQDNGGAAAAVPHPVGAIPPGGGGGGSEAAAEPAAHLASPPPQNVAAAAGDAAGAVAKPGESPEDDAFLQSVSLSQPFVHAFVASLSVIVVSELGDKTFFIAAIMAMKHARSTVFAGAIAALGIMTLLSALGGTLG